MAASDTPAAATRSSGNTPKDRHVILFYKYTKLSSDRSIMEAYMEATKALCTSLELTGRVSMRLPSFGLMIKKEIC